MSTVVERSAIYISERLPSTVLGKKIKTELTIGEDIVLDVPKVVRVMNIRVASHLHLLVTPTTHRDIALTQK